MKENTLEQKIEAILFYTAEPVEISFLVKTLDTSKEDIHAAVNTLAENLEGRGLRLVFHEESITLVTAPEYADTIEKIVREERERDLGRAGLETLSIIAYKGPVSKKEIEYIRGVNCQFALRSLLLRGLVERTPSKTDGRLMVYTVTDETVRYLGLGSISELPEYESVRSVLAVEPEEEADELE